MIASLDGLIRDYGVLAVFAGSLFEGESVAIVGGFFAHQAVLQLTPTFVAAMLGAFVGDMTFYVLGRRFAHYPWVEKVKEKPGFAHAMRLATSHPRAFVFFNRYAYGLRVAGGVACGLSGIGWKTFLLFNFLSSVVWATVFVGIGYYFGLGLEALVGEALHRHQRLAVALVILVVAGLAVFVITRIVRRRERVTN
jgi:membrane protein DedA with SNARE-associated domain